MFNEIKLFDYQEDVVQWVLESDRIAHALFAEMGTGKTPMSIELINRSGLKKLIVFAPKDTIGTWESSCAPDKFNCRAKKQVFVHNPARFTPRVALELASADSFILVLGYTSYSASQKVRDNLHTLIAQLNVSEVGIILDESHTIKNNTAQVTKQFLKLGRMFDSSPFKIVLTGTPHPNFLYEVYPQLNFLRPKPFSYCDKYWQFYTTHTETRPTNIGGGRTIQSEVCNRDEARAIDDVRHYVRYIKKDEVIDVLGLPELRTRAIKVPLSADALALYQGLGKASIDLFEAYRRMKDPQNPLEELAPALLSADKTERRQAVKSFAVKNAVLWVALTVSAPKALANLRMLCSDVAMENTPKMKALLEELSDGKPTIVYAPYVDAVKGIIALLLGNGFSKGDIFEATGSADLSGLESLKPRLIVATQSKLSQGLNLVHFKKIIYYSNDWSYTKRVQSEARIHRYGQEDDVEVVDLVYDLTVEEEVLEGLRNKENASKRILELFKQGLAIDRMEDYDPVSEMGALADIIRQTDKTITMTSAIKKYLEDKEN